LADIFLRKRVQEKAHATQRSINCAVLVAHEQPLFKHLRRVLRHEYGFSAVRYNVFDR
jgi:hypothetical protein